MSSARFPSPFRQGREQAEQSLHEQRAHQQSLEEELLAVRRQLEAVRGSLGGTPGATPAHQASWPRSTAATPTPTPYGAAQHTPSYQALSRGMNTGAPPRKAGVDAYFTARLQKLLGAKVDIHNLLDHPGVTIEEAFGAVLAAPAGDGTVPWIITDDRAHRPNARQLARCISLRVYLCSPVSADAPIHERYRCAQAGRTTCTRAITTTCSRQRASLGRRSM
jgi:hypothetical protein|eukprot:COSAG06_NODE_99_length_24156_cov_20.889549_6_plen_221_part_00